MTLHFPVQYQKDGFGRPFFWLRLTLGFAKINPLRRRNRQPLTVSAGAGWPVMWGVVGLGLLCWSWAAGAQSVIYRCGHEYTNAPSPLQQCERLAEQAVTVISGLRPSSARASGMADVPAPDEQRTKTEPARPVTALQSERDVQSRTILDQELQRVRRQHQVWVQAYKQGTPHADPERATALKADIDRAERDIDSLQRELARRPLAMKPLKP